MTRLYAIFCACLLLGPASPTIAQHAEVRGRVVEAKSGEPVPAINVFIAHTTLGAATDEDGRYVIRGAPAGPAEVVASAVGYQPQHRQLSLAPGERVDGIDFRLAPTTYELEGIDVSAERPREWQRNAELFSELILGDTPHAKDAAVVNPHVVTFEREADRLKARASAPIVIENPSLGYRLSFVLREFSYELDSDRLSYRGAPYFEEMSADAVDAEGREARRKQAFLGSLKHMLWASIHGRLFEEGFLIARIGERQVLSNPGGSGPMRPVMTLRDRDIIDKAAVPGTYRLAFRDYLQVTYRPPTGIIPQAHRVSEPSEQVSWLKLVGFSAQIYEDGTPDPLTPVAVSGFMSTERLAATLPRDYVVRLQRELLGEVEEAPVQAQPHRFLHDPDWVHPPESDDVRLAVSEMKDGEWLRAISRLNRVLDEEPGHVEARYYRAIAHREVAALQTLLHYRHFGRGIQDFREIVRQDSAYRDVLYQLALYGRVEPTILEFRNAGISHEEALELAHAQLRLHPDAQEHSYHLYKIYRHFIADRNAASALEWLETHPSDWSTYFKGEVLRRSGQMYSAEAVFRGLLETDTDVPRQPALLSLARVYYRLNRPEVAQALVYEAIDGINGWSDAAFVFEDVKYLVDTDELEQYRSLRDRRAFVQFFRAFWNRRNPLPGQPLNPRIEEHYRRLDYAEQHYAFDGFRRWMDNPDKSHELTLPAPYRLNEEFNDKGLVYVRLGEPSERIRTVSGDVSVLREHLDPSESALPKDLSPSAPWVPNESWRYTGLDLDFHFVVDEDASGNNWRLAPALTNRSMLDDRVHWGGAYVAMARAAAGESMPTSSELDFVQARGEIAERSRRSVASGLNMDRHTWRADVEPLEFPYMTAAFRGDDGSTRLSVYYGLPIGRMARRADSDSLQIQVGTAVHDISWRQIAQERVTFRVDGPRELADGLTQSAEFSAPPDSYRVAIHSRVDATDMIGGYRFTAHLPAFPPGELALSDIVPAYDVTSSVDIPTRRSDLDVQVNPSGTYSIEQLVHVYFEVYDLTFGRDDLTDYSIEYRLVPSDEPSFFRRLLGRSPRPSLTLKTRQTSAQSSPIETAAIDVRNVEPGRYVLGVRVTDENTGSTAQRSREIVLVE